MPQVLVQCEFLGPSPCPSVRLQRQELEVLQEHVLWHAVRPFERLRLPEVPPAAESALLGL
jgi:hypothetical protein